jgi:hypothetical protein
MTVAEIKEQIIAILKESLSPIRNEEGCLTMAISESNIDFIADEIVKLFQCKNIIAKVKEANTPDKRSFEEAEKDKPDKFSNNEDYEAGFKDGIEWMGT